MSSLKYLPLAVLLLLTACQPDGEKAPAATTEAPAKTLQVPAFVADSAYQFVEKQLAFGPRVPNSTAHQATREWLVEKLKSYGASVEEQNFQAAAYTGEKLNATNIIGQFNPQAGKRILLAAHWDTRFAADSPLNTSGEKGPVPGADDGASGVAVLLEVARQLHANPLDIGVDIIFFDAEDQGRSGTEGGEETWGLGAQYWSRHPHRGGYQPKYGILLDMVGAENARFPKEYWSVYFAGQLVDKVWKLARSMGYGNFFAEADGGGVTDDHYFVNSIAGIRMIDIINRPADTQSGFGPHWHTPDDDLPVINKRTLRVVGQVVLAILYRENNGTF